VQSIPRFLRLNEKASPSALFDITGIFDRDSFSSLLLILPLAILRGRNCMFGPNGEHSDIVYLCPMVRFVSKPPPALLSNEGLSIRTVA